MVTQVQFSDDGAQVVSSGADNTVRMWDVASGTQTHQFFGGMFALVEGPSDLLEHTKIHHVLTAERDLLLIYAVTKEQSHTLATAPMASSTAPVASFKAPNTITSVLCHGAVICVACEDGAVCMLSAPFLAP
jgi:WD40 repeat protein